MPHFIFILVLSVAGQPERIAAMCDTYKQCSDLGADVQLRYVAMFNRAPSDVSYRIVEVNPVSETGNIGPRKPPKRAPSLLETARRAQDSSQRHKIRRAGMVFFVTDIYAYGSSTLYVYEDAVAVRDWLNDRAAGYPRNPAMDVWPPDDRWPPGWTHAGLAVTKV